MIGGKQKLLFQPLSELSVLNSLPLMFQDCKKQNQACMLFILFEKYILLFLIAIMVQ